MAMVPSRRNLSDRSIVLISFGILVNLTVLGIVILALFNRAIPEVLGVLAVSLASTIGGAMAALGFRPPEGTPSPSPALTSHGRQS